MNITAAYFSPSNTTKKVVNTFAAEFSESFTEMDLLRNNYELTEFSKEELLIVGMPVFGGVIPSICVPMLKKLKGNNTKAIIIANFGNRDFDDALLQMKDILNENGFVIIGAMATISEHSLFDSVATNRPNKKDLDEIKEFALTCKDRMCKEIIEIEVTGKRPYKVFKGVPFVPTADANCNGCGECSKVCPTNAIGADPTMVDLDKCICCTACIAACPIGSRGFHNPTFFVAKKGFSALNSKPKTNIYF